MTRIVKRARLVAESDVPVPDALPPQWPGRFVLLDGRRTFVRRTPPRCPNPEPALYLHGLGGSATNWTDLAYFLATCFDADAIDLPGFGHSDPADRYSINSLADRVIRWIEYSGKGPVHLFGNSLGGAVAVRVAGTRPDLVKTLTLLAPAMPFLNPKRSAQGWFAPLSVLPQAHRIAAWRIGSMSPEELARTVFEACVGDVNSLPPQRLEEAWAEIRYRYTVPWYLDAYVRTLRGLVLSFLRAYLPGPGSLWRVASHITAPTLVVAGNKDQVVDLRVAAQVARTVKDSRLLVLPNVGHVPHMERPAAVARAVMGMLSEPALFSQPA